MTNQIPEKKDYGNLYKQIRDELQLARFLYDDGELSQSEFQIILKQLKKEHKNLKMESVMRLNDRVRRRLLNN